MLKENLVNLMLLYSGFIGLAILQTNQIDEEYCIINLVCKEEKVEHVSDLRLKWSDYGFTNYQKLNHENIVNFDREEFDLDLWFNEMQKSDLTQKVQSIKPTKIQKKDLPVNVNLVTKDYGQLRRTVYSFSQPIFQEGKDGIMYAFILVSQTFESEGWTKYYFLENDGEKWEIKAVRMIGFS